MRLYNTTKINASDYPEEDQQTMDQFGEIYNLFVDEVENILNKNIDFENLNQELITIDIQVDSSGKPLSGGRVNVPSKPQPQGFQVIRAVNLSNQSKYVKSQPFISYAPLGTGLTNILNVSGLEANDKYRIWAIVY
jgi:hypothetical protein